MATVIEVDSEAVAATHAVVKLAQQMAKGLSAAKRANVASALRDVADSLDVDLCKYDWRQVT